MKKVLHKANSRGKADHGWLLSRHTFSFANYVDPDRMHFGVLRVLNDDVVAPGRGFDAHRHENMEIISIPLEGDLEHRDSMGNLAVIRKGDVQVMSAGTGIYHSEYNKNKDREVKFLQIWVIPDKKGVTPRYDQITLDKNQSKNKLVQILSPSIDDEGVWINQNAWFHLGHVTGGATMKYNWRDESNGLYVFVIEGEADVSGVSLRRRDGLGIWEANEVVLEAQSDLKVLLMEVPMGNL